MTQLAKILILAGVGLVVIGLLVALGAKIPGMGRLPGDFIWRKDDFIFYFPFTTCLVVSLILTLFMSLFKGR